MARARRIHSVCVRAIAQRLRPIQRTGIGDRRRNKRDDHAAGRSQTADVEQTRVNTEHEHPRFVDRGNGAGSKHETKLGRTEAGERQPKPTAGVCGEITLRRYQEEGRDQRQRDPPVHEA